MKKFNLALTFILYISVVEGQKIESPFNEFTISINRTQVADDNTENRNGFGIGAYHSPKTEGADGFVIGVEYDLTRQFKKHVDESGHFTFYEENISYDFNYITIYAGHRFNFGGGVKSFIDLGGYLDIGVSSSKQGTQYQCTPFICGSSEMTEDFGSLGLFPGISFAIGARIPVGGIQLILKPEYKFSLTSRGDGNTEERFLFSYYRLAIGIKYF